MKKRDSLDSNRTYYVRTDGNDRNSGLTNDTAGAFLTIQRAVDVVCDDIDNAGFGVAIQVEDGSYGNTVILKPYVGTGAVTLSGNTLTPSNVMIAVSSAQCIDARNGTQAWHITGFRLTTAGTANHCLRVLGSRLTFAAMDFGSCVQNHIGVDVISFVQATGNYTISGGAVHHHGVVQGSCVDIRNRVVTLTGTPAFAGAFVVLGGCSVFIASGDTFSGAATGSRYSVLENSVISTNGGGANYFPGSLAGSASSGGQYL